MSDFFTTVTSPIGYEGPESDNPLAFRWYDKDRVVAGRTMEQALRFAVCYWHSFASDGSDIFGSGTLDRPWLDGSGDPLAAAKAKMAAAFEFFVKLGVPYWCFHDRDIAPEGLSFKESCANLDVMVDEAAAHMAATGTKLLWGTANLFSNPRFQAGAATNPDPELFAYAAAQVCHVLEATARLGGENYVLWGGREGYDTLLNTDLRRELDQLGRFLHLVVEHKHRIGFGGTILIEPKPYEPTKHQYDFDVAAVHAFLQRYDLLGEVFVNIEVNHATLAGHDFAHEIAAAFAAGIFGSIDANAGDDRLGWDVDRFPVSVEQMTLGMYELLRNGGLGTGGLNFDAKLRRQSIDRDDLFHAHIGGMDTMARALLAAAALLEDGALERVRTERYAGWDAPLGRAILEGGETLPSLRERALGGAEPGRVSGGQERLENLVARYIERAPLMAVVVGIDSSTQSTKAEARDLHTGEVLATGRAAHRSTAPPVSEQDPADWWAALVGAVGQVVAALGPRRDDIVALSVAGQQHGLVLLDGHDRVLRPAKLWNDTTSAAEASELVAALGPARWAEGCASVPVAAFTITKLAWVLRHEPAVAAQVARVALPHDHLTWRLTQRHVTDRGDASGTGWFDPAAGRYRDDLLDALDRFGPSPGGARWVERLPQVLGPFEAAGELTSAAAAELGLPRGVVVGPGTGDNMAAALGLGLAPGDVALSLGTSGTVYAVSDTPSADPSGAVAGFADATGRFLPLVCTLNATKVTDTVAAWLGTDPAGLAELALDAARTGGADRPGPVLVPYFDGERTPNRPEAAGSLHGLRTTTTRAELALAAHDGVLCGLLDGLDALRAAGVGADGRLHLIGGGARSAAYRQRAADLHGEPVAVPNADETVATGAALQAALVYRLGSQPSPTGPDGTPLGPSAVAAAWRLGDALVVAPEGDASEVRRAYAAARGS